MVEYGWPFTVVAENGESFAILPIYGGTRPIPNRGRGGAGKNGIWAYVLADDPLSVAEPQPPLRRGRRPKAFMLRFDPVRGRQPVAVRVTGDD